MLEKIRDHEKENKLANVLVLLITADLVDVHEDNLKPFNNTTLLKKPIRKNHLLGVIQQSCEF